MCANRRQFRDVVHDYISVPDSVCAFIDTPHFQRLRSIKQLAACYYVWPGASHNRFEHCLGVAHLARQVAVHLKESQPELGISIRDVECVQIAGLCHDLGHGPWSHAFDGLFMPKAKPNSKWQHEDGSEMMMDHLVQTNDIDIPEKDVRFIKALIAGDISRCPDEKPFLFDIVANKRNGIDVDKFDYMLRDGHHLGQKGNLSITRLVDGARVIDNQICYRIKDANQLYELCWTRFSFHKQFYTHKTSRAIEYMIIDALLAADPYLRISECVFDPERFLHLDDTLMNEIEKSTKPELAESRALFKRIKKRDLYRCVDYTIFEWSLRHWCDSAFTPESIVAAAKALPREEIVASPMTPEVDNDEIDDPGVEQTPLAVDTLEPHHVIVDVIPMHHGMKEKNPLESLKFYSKAKPNECHKAEPGVISSVMPTVFAEILLRIYTRDPKYYGIIRAGYNAVLQNSRAESVPTLSQADELPMISPPPTEAPSTPQGLSVISRPGSNGRSFTENTFTSVHPSYAPPSPSKRSTKKRARGDGDVTELRLSPLKTKKRKAA